MKEEDITGLVVPLPAANGILHQWHAEEIKPVVTFEMSCQPVPQQCRRLPAPEWRGFRASWVKRARNRYLILPIYICLEGD
ncbi:MAG: hypothetical protein ACWGP1_12010 [Syntrophobacteria bacterium]